MSELTLSLFDPNTLLAHRAGIAGLALALASLSPDDAPLAWNVTEDKVQLRWDGSDRAAISWLTNQTYQVEDGYLNIPALKLTPESRYTFTQGVTATLLQHSKQRALAKSSQPLSFSLEAGQPEITLNYRPLLDCYYTRDLKDAFTSKGQFKSAIALKGHHLPGLVECFVNGPYQETPAGFVALLFLPLACNYYQLPGRRSALVIPEVTNLKQWVSRRQSLSGLTYQEFRATGAGEAGLRFLLQEQSSSAARAFRVDYCEVYQLGKQIWDGNQSYLKQAVYRVRATDELLSLYGTARALFPHKVRVTDKGESWLATSKVLPWLADNLIAGRCWYEGFYDFRKANQLYERGGLVKMTDHLGDNERILFDVVQGAFSAFLREQIEQAKKQGRELDYSRVTDKAINRLQHPSTKQQFATALVKFLSRHRSRAASGQGLQISGWIHSDENWRRARDLALLAIATYQGKGKTADADSEAAIAATETEDAVLDPFS